MQLRNIGERKITKEITERFSIPYDDCSFIEMGDDYLLITTDMVYRKTHFPKKATFYQMGWYSIAINISDIASKGGVPLAYSVALGLPRNMEKESLDEILDGMEDCIKKYGGKLIGGDTKETDEIMIAVTAFGKVKKDEFIPRKGAKIGDKVYVTGSLGKGGAALLENNMEKLLLIEPKLKEGIELAKSKVNCCIDLSDGLAISLYQLMEINNVGFRIYANMLPIDPMAKKYGLEVALYYGGDYELLFTASKPIKNAILIGEVIEKEKVLIVDKEEEKEMERKGYEHFINH